MCERDRDREVLLHSDKEQRELLSFLLPASCFLLLASCFFSVVRFGAMAGGPVDEGFAAKAAGAAVLSGIAWSIYKSTAKSLSRDSPVSRIDAPSSSAAGAFHISKGDTLFSISQRYGVSCLFLLLVSNQFHGFLFLLPPCVSFFYIYFFVFLLLLDASLPLMIKTMSFPSEL